MKSILNKATVVAALLAMYGSFHSLTAAPVYEPAFANGQLVTISVKDPFPGKVAGQAQGAYFEVIYPIGWASLTTSVPQCNPCDHGGDGEDMHDYHDHVFAGQPSQPGGGVYKPLWRLHLVTPAYTNDLQHNIAVSVAYAARLPVKSEQAVRDLLALRVNNLPVATLLETDYVFMAAFVNANAVH